MIRNIILKSLYFFTLVVFKTLNFSRLGRKIVYQFLDLSREVMKKVKHENNEFVFYTPNSMALYRANTFSDKEPETLEWIKSMSDDKIFWDIGANVGLYSIYAAKVKSCNVFAFEPSVFNIELLAKNININGLNDLISIIPLPLNNKTKVSKMRMTSTQLGGAMSSFNHNYGFDGNEIDSNFEYAVLGIKMDDLVQKFNFKQPNYIKIDVDGIEHFILEGGRNVLLSCESILIEINDNFTLQANRSETILIELGFYLDEKRHGKRYEDINSKTHNTFNQIWRKKS